MTKIPNIAALRAFEAVVRHKSLAGAAAELMVTPSAISHRLRQLEDELEIKLLRRAGRRLVLTDAGRKLAAPLTDGMDLIFHAVDDLREADSSRPLTISMLHNIAVNWFLPRLDRFHARHPDIEVRLLLTAEYVDFSPETADMAIRHSPGPWPGHYSKLLLEDRLTPVCSPEFLERFGPFTSARQLQDFPLIASSTRLTDDWSAWYRMMGVELSASKLKSIMLDSTHLALQAAANGLGLSIAGLKLTQPMMARGALVAPFEHTIPERGKYYIVCPKDWHNREKIRQMRKWLMSESKK